MASKTSIRQERADLAAEVDLLGQAQGEEQDEAHGGMIRPRATHDSVFDPAPRFGDEGTIGMQAAACSLPSGAGSAAVHASRTKGILVELSSDDLDEEVVRGIWKKAMEASVGQVDLERFEKDWKIYVKNHLKD